MISQITVNPETFGAIPAPNAMILWTDREGVGVVDVAVCLQQDPEAQDRHRFESSRGVCDASWLDGDPLNSPIGIFLWMATIEGFQSPEVKIKVLAEMARIEGQDWAITMLKALGAVPFE